MPHAKNSCEQRLLAQRSVGTVAICSDCKVVHLHLAYASLRFEFEAYQDLLALLVASSLRLQACAAPAHDSAYDSAGGNLH